MKNETMHDQVSIANIDINALKRGLNHSVLHSAGSPETASVFRIRELNEDDLPQLMSLQKTVYDSLPDRELFVFTTEEECADSITHDICIGIFDGNEMAAASILIKNRESERNHAEKLELDPLKCAVLDSVFVAPAYRGLGFQKLLIRICMSVAWELGCEIVIATVAPGNTYSLDNFKLMGFKVRFRGRMYGDHDRYIMMRKK